MNKPGFSLGDNGQQVVEKIAWGYTGRVGRAFGHHGYFRVTKSDVGHLVGLYIWPVVPGEDKLSVVAHY